jgi:hypothetical protein
MEMRAKMKSYNQVRKGSTEALAQTFENDAFASRFVW